MPLDPRAWREREDRGRRPADDVLWRVREVLRIRLEASTETSRGEIEGYDAGDDFPHLVARYFHGPVQRRRMVVALDARTSSKAMETACGGPPARAGSSPVSWIRTSPPSGGSTPANP